MEYRTLNYSATIPIRQPHFRFSSKLLSISFVFQETDRLCHLSVHLFAAQNMQMQVLDGLLSIVTAVGDNAEAAFDNVFALGDHRRHAHQVRQLGRRFRSARHTSR